MDKLELNQQFYEKLTRSLTHHTPTDTQLASIEAIRETAIVMARLITYSCPSSRERSLAATHLEETVMWAVKAVILDADES